MKWMYILPFCMPVSHQYWLDGQYLAGWKQMAWHRCQRRQARSPGNYTSPDALCRTGHPGRPVGWNITWNGSNKFKWQPVSLSWNEELTLGKGPGKCTALEISFLSRLVHGPTARMCTLRLSAWGDDDKVKSWKTSSPSAGHEIRT